jgi:AcrR family transcriptional regulator
MVQRKPGRPATASRDDVLRVVREQFLAGERVDLTMISNRLGLGRATIYRWFGSRELLLGETIATELERLVAFHRAQARRRGARGLLDVFDRVNRSLAESVALRALLEQERGSALRLLTSSAAPVQPRSVACIRRLIEAEVEGGTYEPPIDPGALAYAIVRLAEAFLYNDAAFGIRGDWSRLHQVEAALLGIGTTADPGVRPSESALGLPPGATFAPPQPSSRSHPGSQLATAASRRSGRRRRSPAAG